MRKPADLFIRAAATTDDDATIEGAFHFGGAVTIQASAGGEKPGPRRFDMVAYTGGPLHLPNFEHPVVVDLNGMEGTGKSRPILKDHQKAAIVGHTDKIVSDGRQLVATGVVSGGGAVAREVLAAADNGFPWQASIGARVINRTFVPQGRTVQVNGQTFSGPLIHATRTRLGEISFVALGADDNTSARIAAEAAEGTPMNFEQWLKAKGFDPSALNDASKQFLKAQFDAEIKAAEGGSDTVKAANGDDAAADDDEDPVLATRKAVSAEKKRLAKIGTITAQYAGRVAKDKLATIEASAIDEAWTPDRVELELLRAERPTASNQGGGSGRPGKKLSAAVICAALSISAGLSEKAVGETVKASEREQVMNDATSGEMRGFSLHALMDAAIHAAGLHFHGSRKSTSFIETAIRASRTLDAEQQSIEADGFSSLSLSNILSNVANKGLIASYSAVEVAWPEIAAVRNHSDFKIHTRYRLDSTGSFRKVAADGELKHVGLSDAAYTNQLGTFGAIIALTRQMMTNDDLGAFMEIPSLLGRMAALRLEELVFTLLLSNPATNAINFFSTTNKNYMSGAATALSLDALTTAEQKFGDFVDSNNKPILVSPKKLLVGTALKTLANKIYKDTTLIGDGVITSAKSQTTNQNPHAGKYVPICSPYLNNTSIKNQDNGAITGQSSTLWLLLADPAVRAAIAVAFLNGQRSPTIESSSTEFNTLGMQWRAYHDFGAGMEETSAAVESAGA